ncbi:MAG: cobyric acid synthase [Candidatus Metalachnospira sp.]|nr:cobyric acid synthase [Candidatus Metalachnospira sp.]
MAKVIMIQGTMSNVGKSYVTAGLLRVFKQDGLKAAPFKSQNMALNSFVTNEGLEMGRAQVMQAEAAGIEPCADMNPILLKPTTDIGSQVIVNGKSIGNMQARDYFEFKKKLVPDIIAAYNRLAEKYDVIVIEGAGSPAEINLKENDIVNMGMAEMVNAPVILVGDIDRGGVFAQLAGTYMLLEENEKSRIKGFVMNKFRGDKSILDSGITMLEKICPVAVLGVLPYTPLQIDDEDSLSDKLSFRKRKADAEIVIGVIKLPRMSNFTDFGVLDAITEVEVRYITKCEDAQGVDCIIIPGTKNTISDLIWLKTNGFDNIIKLMNGFGCPVIGICGGYQMLGNQIIDACGAEGDKGAIEMGLGLLPISTEMQEDKICRNESLVIDNVSGFWSGFNGISADGYEIHMGETVMEGKSIKSCGKGNVFGTYLHGLFDRQEFLNSFLSILSENKGIDAVKTLNYSELKEHEYDKLADMIRKNIDINAVYSILEKE